VIEISFDLHKLDFLDLHNVFSENYFAKELTIDRSFLKQFKTFAVMHNELMHNDVTRLDAREECWS
jgi:hypothetical protein